MSHSTAKHWYCCIDRESDVSQSYNFLIFNIYTMNVTLSDIISDIENSIYITNIIIYNTYSDIINCVYENIPFSTLSHRYNQNSDTLL